MRRERTAQPYAEFVYKVYLRKNANHGGMFMQKLLQSLLVCTLALFIVLGTSVPALAAETPNTVAGSSIACENVALLDDGNHCSVLRSTTRFETIHADRQEKTALFTYDLLPREGASLAKMEVQVTAAFADGETTSLICSVCFDGEQADQLSGTISYEGDTAVVAILMDETEIGTLSYQLGTDGFPQWI